MQTGHIYHQSLSDEVIRQILAQKCLPHTSAERNTNVSIFIIEGKFLSGQVITASGEKRTIKGTAYTALNENTFSKAALITAIKENRLAKVLTNPAGLVTEIHLHPEWMEKIEKNDALDVLVRDNLNTSYQWLKENDTIGIGSVGTHQHYENMIRSCNLGWTIKA